MTPAQSIDPLADPRWRELLDRCPAATPFHHPSWLQLLRDQYGYDLTAVAVTDAGGELCAGLPVARIRSALTGRRLVALPFSDACPPLVAQDASDVALAQLEDALRLEQSRSGVGLEVRDPMPGLGGEQGESFYQHVLPLGPDPTLVEAGFSKSQIKRGIKKAVREGVTIERSTSRGALDDFYRLHLETRRRQGVPTQPRRFIGRFEGLFDEGLGFVLLARSEGETISAAVFLTFGSNLVYKYGASSREHLSKRPNNLLFSEAIHWGCTNGIRRLDFGRTDLDNEGLRSFKLAWGSDEELLAYTHLPAGQRRSSGAKGSAPLAFVIRRTPPLVGQAVGQLLYRHVG